MADENEMMQKDEQSMQVPSVMVSSDFLKIPAGYVNRKRKEANNDKLLMADVPEKQRERWLKYWGEDYNASECKQLDNIYENLAPTYDGVTDARVWFNLRKVCIFNFEQMRAVKAGNEKAAKLYADMIASTMALEGMKATDKKNLEGTKVDALVDMLEKKGIMKKGEELLLKDVIKYIKNDYGKYTLSHDGLDAIILYIINAMRSNNGMDEWAELPADFVYSDEHKEFQEESGDDEKEALREFGIVKNRTRARIEESQRMVKSNEP